MICLCCKNKMDPSTLDSRYVNTMEYVCPACDIRYIQVLTSTNMLVWKYFEDCVIEWEFDEDNEVINCIFDHIGTVKSCASSQYVELPKNTPLNISRDRVKALLLFV